MKRLFCCIKNKIHCLAIKEKITSGLCISINNQPVSVITEENGIGDVVIRNDNINRKIIYRAPGIFYYFHGWGQGVQKNYHALYIENGEPYDIDLGNQTESFGNIYYDKVSGLYYSFNYYTTNTFELRTSYDGIHFNIRRFSPTTDSILKKIPDLNGYSGFNWFDLELLEVVPDNDGGFNFVFCVKADHPYWHDQHYIFCHSFNITNINAPLIATNDVSYTDWTLQSNYPIPPKFYDDPPINTINGFVERQIDSTHWAFEKEINGEIVSYILSTNKIIYDPVVCLYFLIKFGPEYIKGNYKYWDLNLYSNDTLDEETFTFKQKLTTTVEESKYLITSTLSAARQNEYL